MIQDRIKEYRRRISDEMYISAYEILISEIDKSGKTSEIVELSKELSGELRGKAYQYSAKKAEKLANEMGALLKLVIKINGEGIYG